MKPELSVIVAVIALLMTARFPAHALDRGWWVIVASFPEEPWERQRNDFKSTGSKAERCGLKIFNDLSGKFRGFAVGRNVFVIGAFATKARAEERLLAARHCFPDAYVKYGDYAGE